MTEYSGLKSICLRKRKPSYNFRSLKSFLVHVDFLLPDLVGYYILLTSGPDYEYQIKVILQKSMAGLGR